jgi:hypothetical protein
MTRIGKVLLVLLVAASISFAEEVSFTASVDKTSVALDETVTCSLTITGGDGSVNPQMPRFTNLVSISRMQSTRISFYNGQESASTGIILTLKPLAVGTATIGSANLDYKGKSYTTNQITINVTKATGTKKSPVSAKARSSLGSWDELFDNFFTEPAFSNRTRYSDKAPIMAKTRVSHSTAYVNQPIILTFTFTRRVNLMAPPNYQPPETTGFWTENLPVSKDLREETIDGLRYISQDFKTLLYPIAPGNFKIGSAVLTAQIDPFTQPITISTEPINLNILALPANGKPADFSGAVGNYQLSAAIGDNKIERGKPFTIIAKVFGAGNLETVSEPKMELGSEFKKLSSQTTKGKQTKTFKMIILPLKEGSFVIKPLTFSYFKPDQNRYVELKSQPFNLKVLSSNILLPEVQKPANQNQAGVVKISLDWKSLLKKTVKILVYPVLFIIAVILARYSWLYRQTKLQANPIRNQRRQLRQRFKKAESLLKTGQLAESLAEIYNAVSSISWRENVDFITECDLLRFTPGTLDKAKVGELLKRAQKLI